YPTFLFLLGMFFFLFGGCDKYSDHDKYKRPDWLPGKLYTSVLVQKNLSLFAECLRLTGLDTIINVSGSWTVFAPTDDAMRQYLAENNYSRVSDIPIKKLDKLTKFHIIQNQWSLLQLKTLGKDGWRTVDNAKSDSYAYKRETILRISDEKYWLKRENKIERIVSDSTIADRYKRVFTSSRKFVPIFYDQYFTVNGVKSEDYNFYFNRAFEPGNVYYGGAKIIQADIFAENGFVHIIDRVVDPMLNAKERLERKTPGESYQLFLDMVYWYYPQFVLNMIATNRQPGVKYGAVVDTLWDLNYAPLAFNPQKEQFDIVNQTLVKHNGLIAPIDAPFKKFIDEILTVKSGFPHWYDYKSLPLDVVDIIVGQNFKSSPIYPSKSQYQKIFKGTSRFHQNEEDIIRKDFGSNCTFIGLGSYIPDRVFTSVTAPVFCRPVFSIFRQAMVYSGAYDAIANHKGKLYFFPITDYSLMADSSLLVNWIDKDKNHYNFMAFNRQMHKMEFLSSKTLSDWILNQVGTSTTGGDANKEIIKTLGGNYLTWDHSNNTIQGTLPSTFGYKGNVIVTNSPFPMDEPTDNGKSLTVKNWFNFGN
ncbi:MAG TPA: fasciclin domain-containing protein, partial [Candidatus Kapabacteria bacterium]|nr:fasciclin domain-containing protein [Candidatus Kapabacteria bacterium]